MSGRSVKQRNAQYADSQYPPDWTDIADRTKTAALWRCERCKHPHETIKLRAECDDQCTHPQNGKLRMLTVHHLDLNKANCADYNLAALCQVCHLQIQAKVDFEHPYAFEHSAWMQPHVDGLEAARRKEVNSPLTMPTKQSCK